MPHEDTFTRLLSLAISIAIIATCIFGIHYCFQNMKEKAEADTAVYHAIEAQKEADNYIYAITHKDIVTVGLIGHETRYKLSYDVTYTLDGKSSTSTDHVYVTETVFEEINVGDKINVLNLKPAEIAAATVTETR